MHENDNNKIEFKNEENNQSNGKKQKLRKYK